MSDASPVIVRRVGQIGRLTLSRPKALHALDQEMCEIMAAALRAWKDDNEIKVVLVDHAADTRGFCAGGDIRMLAESGAGDGVAATNFFREEYRLNTLIKHFPKPDIALMNGVTMGGGVGISVHGSHRIATENTVFAMPETGIGLFPDVGGGWFLPRLPGEVGMWLALTGARLKGSDVVAARVATHYIPTELIGNLTAELERADLSLDGANLVNTILASRAKRFEPASFEAHRDRIDECFGKSSVEEVITCLESMDDDWCKAQLKVLATKSPQTLKVAFRQLREGAAFETFEDNMRNEFRIGWRQVRSADFLEGVRAVIIDKDNAPVWPSGNLNKISDEIIDKIFAPLGEEELTFE